MKKNQLTLFDIEPEKSLNKWMLVFRQSVCSVPEIRIGTLDYIYSEHALLSHNDSDYFFACIYNPRGKIHRRYGKTESYL